MERATYRPAAGMCRFGDSRRVLLMDEPFAAVDAQTRADLIRDLWHRFQVTTLFVTHDIDEAVYLGQRVLILSSSPAVVRDDLAIDLPDERDQLTTRSSPRFAELRARVYDRCTARSRRRSSRSPAERSAGPNGSEHPPLDHDSARSDRPVR
jgi:NitT/TauT family transport system ATP-binding protein